ncbi:hypothetical protein [Arthrobacter sp. efr-133-TYG-120]|uniref:hypothetical protein n=1 Tax=Arthrobacter sp. efr-133-TYG-120 TaxID=3040280 RepID=UPI00255107EF|nr:hypothetical protein [Arthrobacter sp. efr-133-TYG-120]
MLIVSFALIGAARGKMQKRARRWEEIEIRTGAVHCVYLFSHLPIVNAGRFQFDAEAVKARLEHDGDVVSITPVL